MLTDENTLTRDVSGKYRLYNVDASEQMISVCDECMKLLKRKAIVDYFVKAVDYGVPPPNLPKLTYAERCLLRLVKICGGQISRITTPMNTTLRMLKGHLIGFAHANVVNVLAEAFQAKQSEIPHPITALGEEIQICFVGNCQTAEEARELIKSINL